MLTSLLRFSPVTKLVLTGYGPNQSITGLNRFFVRLYTQNSLYLTIVINMNTNYVGGGVPPPSCVEIRANKGGEGVPHCLALKSGQTRRVEGSLRPLVSKLG